MNEYKIHCICKRCGAKDIVYLSSEKNDKESVKSDAYRYLEEIEDLGHMCEECYARKFAINKITFVPEG